MAQTYEDGLAASDEEEESSDASYSHIVDFSTLGLSALWGQGKGLFQDDEEYNFTTEAVAKHSLQPLATTDPVQRQKSEISLGHFFVGHFFVISSFLSSVKTEENDVYKHSFHVGAELGEKDKCGQKGNEKLHALEPNVPEIRNEDASQSDALSLNDKQAKQPESLLR